jgi:hypothetical protein
MAGGSGDIAGGSGGAARQVDFSRVGRSELIAIIGGVLLAVALFLPWYHAKTRFALLNGHVGPWTGSAWTVHSILRWFLLAGAVAPLILAYIIVTGAALSWPRGELTAVVAIVAFGLIAYNSLITRPGNARDLIALRYGVWLAIAGTALMLYGAAQRSSEVERGRKPPGTI